MFGRDDLKKLLANTEYSDGEEDPISNSSEDREMLPMCAKEESIDDDEDLFTINVDNGLQVLSMDGTPQRSTLEIVEDVLSDQNVGEMVVQGGGTCEQIARLLGDDENYYSTDSDASEDEDHAAKFDSELFALQKKSIKRGTRTNTKLPENLRGLLGEANISLCRGDQVKAMENCNEIVKHFPYSADAYHILASIYQQMNKTQEAINCYLAAAFLSPSSQAWKNCAQLLELIDPRQAAYCLNRAIKSDPRDLNTHREYLRICEEIGDKQKTLKGYKRCIRNMTEKDGEEAMKITRVISRTYYEQKDYQGALKALQKVFVNHPTFITYNELNMACELMLELPNYPLCVQTLLDFSTVRLRTAKEVSADDFKNMSLEEQLGKTIEVVTPEDFPMELKTKLMSSLIHMKHVDLCRPFIKKLLKSDPQHCGEDWLALGEALHTNHLSAEAIPILRKLANHPEYEQAAVLLLLAECLDDCEEYKKAADCLAKVVVMASNHTGAKLLYSKVLEKMGETEAAKSVLNMEDNSQCCALLYRQCLLHKEAKQTEEFIDKAKLLMLSHIVYPRSLQEADILVVIRKFSSRKHYLTTVRTSLREPLEESQYTYEGEDVSPQQHWRIFKDLCDALYKSKRFAELERFTIGARGSKIFTKVPDMASSLDFFCLLGCIHNESYVRAFSLLRSIVPKYAKCNRLWNLMAFIISKSDETRFNRFLLGLTVRYPESLPLTILRGNSCLTAGSYKFALVEYILAFKENPSNSTLALLTSLIYVHMACQKFTAKKHQLVIQATAFLQAYWDLSGDTQQAFYNMGRAFHQLSQFHIAIHFYKLALEIRPVNEETDLTFCAAYNLSLIYKPNNKDLARYYLTKYCVL